MKAFRCVSRFNPHCVCFLSFPSVTADMDVGFQLIFITSLTPPCWVPSRFSTVHCDVSALRELKSSSEADNTLTSKLLQNVFCWSSFRLAVSVAEHLDELRTSCVSGRLVLRASTVFRLHSRRGEALSSSSINACTSSISGTELLLALSARLMLKEQRIFSSQANGWELCFSSHLFKYVFFVYY